MQQGDEHKTLGRYSAWEYILMALTAFYEAADQGEEGMRAVCWTIRNRALMPGNQWYGNDIEEVVLKKWQYSALAGKQAGGKEGALSDILPGDPSKNPAWATALHVAESTYLGMGIDPTNGATHYYAPKLVGEPKWVKAPGTTFKKEIGDHLFYKAN